MEIAALVATSGLPVGRRFPVQNRLSIGRAPGNDIQLASPVTLRNANDSDVTRWRWTILDVPIGSAVPVNSTATTTELVFTPDVEGTYRVQLAVNDGAEGEVDTRILGIRTSDGFLYPAADQRAEEANYDVNGSPNTKNWAKEVEFILRNAGGGQESDTGVVSYASDGVSYAILHDFDGADFPEDTVRQVFAEITAGSGGGGLIFARSVALRGHGRRPQGGVLAEASTITTDGGNLPGVDADLFANGNVLELRFRTTRVDDIEVAFTIRFVDIAVDTA